MSALSNKVLDLAEQQGLLDGKAIAALRKQVAESKFIITPEAIAKVLVDHGHLTPFQARKLVSQAQGNEPDPVEQRVAEKAKLQSPKRIEQDLTFADEPPPSRTQHVPAKPPAAEAKPVFPAAERSKERPPTFQPPTVQPPTEGSTAEDLVELKSIEPARPVRGNRWKTDSPEGGLSETVELSPIDLGAPAPPPTPDLAPIDDLFGPEEVPAPTPRSKGRPPPVAVPSDDLVPLDPIEPLPVPVRQAPPARQAPWVTVRPPKNIWDSPLLLIGGGALGVILVLFFILFYVLTRGTAAEMFSKAEEEYRSGAYVSAAAIYDKFLAQYPSDANASLARVRRGMASLRQVTEGGTNPRVGLDTAKQVLPQIDAEEKFSEARGELATILPDIADGFATQAAQTQDSDKKGELVALAGETLTLINNPAYLPTSLRKDRETYIARILDKLKAAQRTIQQDKDLADALKSITESTANGKIAEAYKVRKNLLRSYPALTSEARLAAAVRSIGDKERQLVTVSTGGPAPSTTDQRAGSERIILSSREGATGNVAPGAPVFMLLEGAVYGMDSPTGRVLWRRFVGYETDNQPISLSIEGRADALLVDARQNELVRVNGMTGELVWRQKMAGPVHGPVTFGNRVFVSTQRGSVIAFDGARGEITAAAQLTQAADVAPVASRSRVFQLGEHSTLFVLDEKTLACTETVYLGHEAGEILAPPVAVLDYLIVAKSPADDYTELQAVATDPRTKRLSALGKPQRLKGRIVTPMSVSAGRIAAITDLGQLAVYDVDTTGSQEPLRLIAALEPSEASPRRAYCDLDRNRLWVAGHRRTLFEVQASLSQLTRRWTENFDDTFVSPMRMQGDTLVVARRRMGEPAILIEGCRAATGQAADWTTRLAASLAALVSNDERKSIEALTAGGRLYSLTEERFGAGQAERPNAAVGPAIAFSRASLSADGKKLIWAESQPGRVYFYDLKAGGKPASFSAPGKIIAPAVALGEGAIAPLDNGSIVFLSSNSGAAKVLPFLPALSPDALPQWTRPAALADDKSFLISDGRGTVHAVTKREGSTPQLASVGESKTSGPMRSALVLAGSTVFGVVQQEKNDVIAGFDSRAAAAFEPVPLEGRVEAGPFAVGGLVIVSAEPDGLLCIGGDGRIRWTQPPDDRGSIAGPPLATAEGDLLIAFQSGVVCRIHTDTGRELSRQDVGEPLLGPACMHDKQLYLAGSDGVVHRVVIPARP